jgi:hypothetical protein
MCFEGKWAHEASEAAPWVHARQGTPAIHGARRARWSIPRRPRGRVRRPGRVWDQGCAGQGEVLHAGATPLEPPVGAQRRRYAPSAHHHHGGRALGCCRGVREPQGAAALGEGWAGLAAVVPCAACGGGQHRACQPPRRVRDGGAGLGSGHRRSFSRKQSPGVRGMMFRPQGAQGVQDRFNE